MKILLVCAGGFSTSFLMKKMKEYWEKELGEELEVHACGFSEAGEKSKALDYDCVLIGPQAGFQQEKVKTDTGLPCAIIPPQDYGIGNCKNIHALAMQCLEAKKG